MSETIKPEIEMTKFKSKTRRLELSEKRGWSKWIFFFATLLIFGGLMIETAYGMGTGVFHPAGTPIDHPHGFCYLTNVLRNPKEWKEPKVRLAKTRRLSFKSVDKILSGHGLDKKKIKSIFRQYKSNDILVNKYVKKIQ